MSRQDPTDDDRAARLAEALRANLRKRKAQARARRDGTGADRAPGDAKSGRTGEDDAG